MTSSISIPPFTCRVLGSDAELQDPTFDTLMPATFRTRDDHIITPQPDLEFLEREVSVRRLNDIQDWLWICGRPMPPRSLHHQIVLEREITITENPELHLVWSKGRIFLKPIPAYLLEPNFWMTKVLRDNKDDTDDVRRRYRDVSKCARGFLFSYCALIAYRSDFDVAMSSGLLPRGLTWQGWKTFTQDLLKDPHCYAAVNPRYWYGELRLSRLNKIYKFRKGFLLRGYSRVSAHTVYVDWLKDHFTTLAACLGYVVIVLSAMQVGLATEDLGYNHMFQKASYGFTVFSLIAPLVATAGIILAVLTMVIGNWIATKHYEKRRFENMGVVAYWRTTKPTREVPQVENGLAKSTGSYET